MRATILAPGSRGDVQPYVAIGQALAALGHRSTIVTTLDHEVLVRAHGLDVAPLPIRVADELARVEARRAVEGGGVLASFREFAAIARRASRALAEVGLAASRGADVLVTNFSTALVADGISRKLGVPLVQAYNVPATASSEIPGALFPRLDLGGWSRRLGHRLTRAALWSTGRTAAGDACREILDAPSAPRFAPGRAGLLPGPVLYGFSEAFLARPADWPDEARTTGFWFVEEPDDFAPPAELVRFLEAGPPPVCVGFGSMNTENPEALRDIVLGAAEASGLRMILLSGWAGLDRGRATGDVFVLGDVPHTWLFPRCSAVVHHGGAGTTAAAVRAGVPAVVVPFHGDQPFWAARVERAGLGPSPIPSRELGAARLAAAMKAAATDPALRARAAEVGLAVRSERGAEVAARELVALAFP
ncbi:MAG: glycosyltransferase [Polyangiaceae bacterium]